MLNILEPEDKTRPEKNMCIWMEEDRSMVHVNTGRQGKLLGRGIISPGSARWAGLE